MCFALPCYCTPIQVVSSGQSRISNLGGGDVFFFEGCCLLLRYSAIPFCVCILAKALMGSKDDKQDTIQISHEFTSIHMM